MLQTALLTIHHRPSGRDILAKESKFTYSIPYITNSANEWDILDSSLAEVFMILLSYQMIG
jgi:hypothetical protein